MRLFLIIAVIVADCACGMKDAVASCHLAGSLNASYLQVPAARHAFREFSVEAIAVGSCALPRFDDWSLYLESGLGFTSEHHFTWPVGLGFWYDMSERLGLGVSLSYSAAFGHLTEGSSLLGPLIQYTWYEGEHMFGHFSVVVIPGLVNHFGRESSGKIGAGLTIGIEVAP